MPTCQIHLFVLCTAFFNRGSYQHWKLQYFHKSRTTVLTDAQTCAICTSKNNWTVTSSWRWSQYLCRLHLHGAINQNHDPNQQWTTV